MNRLLSFLILTAICAGGVCDGRGQGPADPKPTPEPTETVIRLKVQAMPAPKPVLRYRLLPELREMNPGNPIQGYLKCTYGHYSFFSDRKLIEQREKWDEMPLKDLPVEKLRGYGGLALREADYAARLDHPDWQALLTVKSSWSNPEESYFPDLLSMRELLWTLKVRMRGEIADRRFDDALVTAQTLFAISRHAAEHPSLAGVFLANAAANFAIEPLEELLAQPGCPNLFWALADLPHPFVDLRLGLQGERITFLKEFGLVDDKAPMTEAEVIKVVDRFQAADHVVGRKWDPVKRVFEKQEPVLRNWFIDRIKDQGFVAAARKRLIESGTAEDLITRFSALQVVFLIQKPVFMERRDDAHKGLLLPYWQMEPLFAARESPRIPTWPVPNDFPFARLVHNLDRVRLMQARLEQRLALLRCVEALRLHAAEHGGQLPAQLADVKLPLPVDQYTGKAFVYKLEGDTATLHGTPPRRLEKDQYSNIRYEVTIAK